MKDSFYLLVIIAVTVITFISRSKSKKSVQKPKHSTWSDVLKDIGIPEENHRTEDAKSFESMQSYENPQSSEDVQDDGGKPAVELRQRAEDSLEEKHPGFSLDPEEMIIYSEIMNPKYKD